MTAAGAGLPLRDMTSTLAFKHLDMADALHVQFVKRLHELADENTQKVKVW